MFKLYGTSTLILTYLRLDLGKFPTGERIRDVVAFSIWAHSHLKSMGPDPTLEDQAHPYWGGNTHVDLDPMASDVWSFSYKTEHPRTGWTDCPIGMNYPHYYSRQIFNHTKCIVHAGLNLDQDFLSAISKFVKEI